MIALPLTHVEKTCLLGQHEKQCMFLARGGIVFWCVKERPEIRTIINMEVSCAKYQFTAGDKKLFAPQGDNCNGYNAEEST